MWLFGIMEIEFKRSLRKVKMGVDKRHSLVYVRVGAGARL